MVINKGGLLLEMSILLNTCQNNNQPIYNLFKHDTEFPVKILTSVNSGSFSVMPGLSFVPCGSEAVSTALVAMQRSVSETSSVLWHGEASQEPSAGTQRLMVGGSPGGLWRQLCQDKGTRGLRSEGKEQR